MLELKHGYPFWLIKSGLPYDYPKLQEDIHTDAVIIGGGISGALNAYYMAKEGIQCVVVDARTIGLGSTCTSTSLLQYELDKPLSQLTKLKGKGNAERVYLLCGQAINKIEEICKDVGFDGYEKRNSLFYAAYKKDVSLLKKEYKARKDAGFDVELLDHDAVKKQYGFDCPSAILSKLGACVDAYMLTHKLLQYAIRKGIGVYDRTKIDKIKYLKNGLELTTEGGFTIKAKCAINATGYEVEQFVGKKIVSLHSTYAVTSECLEGEKGLWEDKTMIWNTADPYLYMRAIDGKRIIVGGRDEEFYNPAKRDKLLKQKAAQLTNDFRKLFPDTYFSPEFSWTGTFGVTKDSLPYIGSYNKIPHTYFALGFGGNGITFSQVAAQINCDLIKGKKNKDVELFGFDR